jgi:DNA-binding MarR family transcriptional regulator
VPQNNHASAKRKRAALTVPAKAGIGLYLRNAYRAFSREFHARLARHNITHAQWVLLWFLSQAGSLTPIALSRQAGIKKASATAVIDSLKRRKLIRGDADTHDRRKLNLSLTPGGAGLMRELIACAAASNTIARAGLTGEEVETLLRLLRVLTGNLERSDGPSVRSSARKRESTLVAKKLASPFRGNGRTVAAPIATRSRAD